MITVSFIDNEEKTFLGSFSEPCFASAFLQMLMETDRIECGSDTFIVEYVAESEGG